MEKEHYRTNFEVLTRARCTTLLVRPARMNIQRIYSGDPYIQACPIPHGSNLVIYPTPPDAAVFEVSKEELEAFYANPSIRDPKRRITQVAIPGTLVFSPFKQTFRLTELIEYRGDRVWIPKEFIIPQTTQEFAAPHYGLQLTIAPNISSQEELDTLAQQIQRSDYERKIARIEDNSPLN